MMVQSLTPSVTVDPLLAKNVLWFFGHPVVYLLLFPTVAVYYLLIPRYAGRALVAGNIITIGWAIAVTANVIVWAHHIYIDYPSGSPQAALNTVMQPLTFSVTIVSALSLYSLFFTIYRSRFVWNAASTALFLGLVSWLLAGLSGVVNATIAFDQIVHNTLWIVGHFHQMAFLAIGLGIIGATYAWLPDLVGKPLYSEALARWHVWLTFVFATAHSAAWIWQGLLGAPRRFPVLPERYDAASELSVPITVVLAAAQLLFAWNIVQTIRGKQRKEAAWQGSAKAIIVGIVALTVAGLGGWAAVRATNDSTPAAAHDDSDRDHTERRRQDHVRQHRLRRLPHPRRRRYRRQRRAEPRRAEALGVRRLGGRDERQGRDAVVQDDPERGGDRRPRRLRLPGGRVSRTRK